MTEVIDPMRAPMPTWPPTAACREPWIAYQYGDRDPAVKAGAATYQAWLDRRTG